MSKGPRRARAPLVLLLGLVLFASVSCGTVEKGPGPVAKVSFAAAADMRDLAGDDPDLFRGACEAVRAGGPVDFFVSPGDIDPPDVVYYTIRTYLSSQMIWYPAVGNHDEETVSDMAWLREFNPDGSALPKIVNFGPPGTVETCYSFDYADAHFVLLNEYYDGTSDTGAHGDVGDALHAWLVADLEKTAKPFVFVIGHEPAYPLPDSETGRLRHVGESLDKYPAHRDRFWQTLASHGVKAYICGHTHNQSASKIDGVWQLDVGHARGYGDTATRSTYLVISVEKTAVLKVYRLDLASGVYVKTAEIVL